MTDKKRSKLQIDFEGPGDMLVEIIRQLFQGAAVNITTDILGQVFSGEWTPEETLWNINNRGLTVKLAATVEVPGSIGESGELDPPTLLGASKETLSVNPGMLTAAEVEPADDLH